jgi:RNA methyltransferase, TrmH family
VPATFAPPTLGKHSPRIRALAEICHGHHDTLTVIDGAKLVADLAHAGVALDELYLAPERVAAVADLPGVAQLADRGRAWQVNPETLARLAPTQHTQGVLAVVARPRHTLNARGVVVYLDRVQDPGNVGSVIRSAAAFGVTSVACSPGCADPFSPRAIRASAGQALRLPIAGNLALSELAPAFVAQRGEVAGAAADGTLPFRDWRPRLPLLLAFGNEGDGLAPEIAGAATTLVRIPLSGGVESLNIAVTCGIILASLAGVAPSPILDSGHEWRSR